MAQLRLLNSSGSVAIESAGSRALVIPSQAINPGVYDRPSSIAAASVGAQGGRFGLAQMSSAASNALANPWDMRSSPVPWIAGGLVVGFIGLHYLHFRER